MKNINLWNNFTRTTSLYYFKSKLSFCKSHLPALTKWWSFDPISNPDNVWDFIIWFSPVISRKASGAQGSGMVEGRGEVGVMLGWGIWRGGKEQCYEHTGWPIFLVRIAHKIIAMIFGHRPIYKEMLVLRGQWSYFFFFFQFQHGYQN